MAELVLLIDMGTPYAPLSGLHFSEGRIALR